MKKVKENGNDPEDKLKQILFSIIYPNKYGQCPLDIAISKNSPKSIEIMFEMIIYLEEYRLS